MRFASPAAPSFCALPARSQRAQEGVYCAFFPMLISLAPSAGAVSRLQVTPACPAVQVGGRRERLSLSDFFRRSVEPDFG